MLKPTLNVEFCISLSHTKGVKVGALGALLVMGMLL